MTGSTRKSEWTVRVLLVEDDSRDASELADLLGTHEQVCFEIVGAESIERALRVLRDADFDVMLLSLSLPEGHGLTAFLRAKEAAASIPIVVLADEEDEALALDAIDRGAQEYLVKQELRALPRLILNAISRHRTLTELREARRRANFLATHDPLCGLLNRYAFGDRIKDSIARAKRTHEKLGLLFIDLDGFKVINDRFGHSVGDQLLLDLAHRLRENVRAGDLAARFGGDEFTLLVHNARVPEGLATLAERLLDSFEAPFVLAGGRRYVTASIGIAVWPDDGSGPDVLLHNADSAMYQAKRSGRNRYHFYSRGLNAAASERLRSARTLRRAIEEAELILQFQPRVDVVEERITGVEALLRWRDADGGVMLPSDFVPTAERLGLMWEVGERLLWEACRRLASWQEQLVHPLRLAVNVSSRQLNDRRFPSLVDEVLRCTGVDAGRVELEVFERVAVQESAVAVATLGDLSRAGVRIALNDFGTDDTALQALKWLPVDRLNIGPSFVREVHREPVDRAVVEAMLLLSRSLGCDAVAVGVETLAQARTLARMGFREMQGLLFGAPDRPEDVRRLLEDPEPAWMRFARETRAP